LQEIGEEIKDERLKRFFLTESLKRAEFRGELEDILHQEGVRDVRETGTVAGAFARAWTGLKAKLGGSEDGLLQAAEEAEHSMIEAYNDGLAKNLPAPIRVVLAEQALWIVSSHHFIRTTRETGA